MVTFKSWQSAFNLEDNDFRYRRGKLKKLGNRALRRTRKHNLRVRGE